MTTQLNVVGRFRAGYVLNDRPATVTEWRITTGDPEVADAVHDILGGEAPQEWAAKGEDNLEVFTASKEVEIVIKDANALRQRLVRQRSTTPPGFDTRLRFYLADATNLGAFEFRTSSHHFAAGLGGAATRLGGNAVTAWLRIETVAYIAKGGPHSGRIVQFAVPALTIGDTIT